MAGNIMPERTVSDAADQTWYGVYRRPAPAAEAEHTEIALIDVPDEDAGHRHEHDEDLEAALEPTYERPVYAPVVELVPLAEAGPDPAPQSNESLAYIKSRLRSEQRADRRRQHSGRLARSAGSGHDLPRDPPCRR